MLALLAGLVPAAGLRAQDLATETSAAEALAAQGKFVEALDAMRDAVILLWEKVPLGFRHALWLSGAPGGWGMYTPRPSVSFAAGEDMIAYAEPVGFGWRRTEDGLWLMDWSADVVIKAKDGSELKRVTDFQHLTVASHERNQEVFASFTYSFSGIPPGDYVVDTILRDKVSGKSGTFSLPFTVR